jgi:hypothetical protein
LVRQASATSGNPVEAALAAGMGAYETIAFPGASLTVPYRSNDRGQIVGIVR